MRNRERQGRELTFLFHSGAETLAQTTVSALVALVFVHDAMAVGAARVDMVSAHTPPEEALAAITTGDETPRMVKTWNVRP